MLYGGRDDTKWIELEVYPSEKVDDPNYYCEIWIAVKEK